MNKIIVISLVLISGIISACTQKQSSSANDNHLFDPAIPGGVLGGDGTITPVSDATINTTVAGQITLTWTVPTIYAPLNYQIMIYKNEGTDPDFVLPDPSQMYNSASLYLVSQQQGTQFIDTNVVDSTSYTYWIYLYVNNEWSTSVQLEGTTLSNASAFTLPTGATFWTQLKWPYGQNPDELPGSTAEIETYSTMGAESDQCINMSTSQTCQSITGCVWSGTFCANMSDVGNMRGKVAIADNGAVMYVADTDNNRVLIYTQQETLTCSQYDVGSDLWEGCMINAEGFPFTATNIIGQPTQYTTAPCTLGCGANSDPCGAQTAQGSCQAISGCAWVSNTQTNEMDCENQNLSTLSTACTNQTGCAWDSTANTCSPSFGLDQCLTRPTNVTVIGTELFISDSGNNRIVWWDHLPGLDSGKTGCDPNIVVDFPTTVDCTHSGQYGKQSLTDETTYTLAVDGNESFNNPTGLQTSVDGNDLYVADTGNNRIIKIADFANTESFSCSSQNWGTSLCEFSGVLGQPSFFVSNTLTSLIAADQLRQQSCESEASQSSCQSTSGCYWVAEEVNGECLEIDTVIAASSLGQTISSTIGDQAICAQLTTETNCQNPPESYQQQASFPPGACTWNSTSKTCSGTPSVNADIMKRYFANPTTIQITSNNQLLVLANENYKAASPVTGNPIEMNSRILLFDINPLDGAAPLCTLGEFNSGNCDASAVVGQQNFNTLVTLSSNTANYTDTNYALLSIGDFILFDAYMIAVDTKNNNVYLWSNLAGTYSAGYPANSIASNPDGASNPNASSNLPILKSLSAVAIDPVNQLIYVTDALGHRVYEVQAYTAAEEANQKSKARNALINGIKQ